MWRASRPFPVENPRYYHQQGGRNPTNSITRLSTAKRPLKFGKKLRMAKKVKHVT
jgi:hypothetical protein